MLKTNYRIKKFEDWIKTSIDFEKKLKNFKKISNCDSKLTMFVSKEYYVVQIEIEYEKN